MTLCSPRAISTPSKPPRLRPGDTIMVIAPASPPHSPTVFTKIRSRLSKAGYRVVFGAHARSREGFLAGRDSERLADINAALRSPSVRAIMAVRGGYGTGRILSSIDFAALRKHPKIVIGCSDLTTILCGCLLESRLISFHGPTAQSLTDSECPEYTWGSLIAHISGTCAQGATLTSGHPDARRTVEVLHRGKVSGRLVGGNLSMLLSLLGTRFFPSLKNAILFLEDVGEAPYRIDRLLTQLLSVGALQQVAGFALGQFNKCEYRGDDTHKKQTVRDVVIERIKPLRKPLVMGLPFGHVPLNGTLPVGSMVTLDARAGDLIFADTSVR